MDITRDTFPGTSRRRLLWVTAIGFTVMLVVGFVAHYLRANLERTTPGWDVLSALASLIYADGEANLWAWASGLLLAAIGLSLAAVGFAVRNESASGVPYFLLAAVAVALSADEIAQLHEKLARFDLGGRFTFAWLTVGVPLAVIVGLIVLWIAKRINRQLRRRLVVAGIIFLLGAVGFEAIGGIVVGGQANDLARASLPYHVMVAFEEGLEVTGAFLALAAALSALSIERTADGILIRTRFARTGDKATKRALASP
ncbi:hypothetical protein E3T39_02235 [Cryobacterium suzukii]|uniref:Uncharacterized protein n=1 Tax=Cryobacterium suzukii TaxID=1259198 RepID=A0A4V3ISY0_9MICO|nr:hypothetical protein [Cryobacterium suzukii]TFD62771.1 hypothetical protein E3T39_02235 [Cryobacterium suzukii]